MSGQQGGFYHLTATKAGFYYRRSDVPADVLADKTGMHKIAAVLSWAGVNVTEVHASWLVVRGSQGDVWAALSGKPADPVHYPNDRY